MKLTKNYYIKKSTNPTRQHPVEQGKKCLSPYHERQQLHRHQYAPLKYLTTFQWHALTNRDIRHTPTTKHHKCSAQHNPHPHNTDKNKKSSTLAHYWVLRQQSHTRLELFIFRSALKRLYWTYAVDLTLSNLCFEVLVCFASCLPCGNLSATSIKVVDVQRLRQIAPLRADITAE